MLRPLEALRPLARFAAALALMLGPGALAQQSMFNVPSGTGTTRGGVFFQEQINASSVGESNLTAAVGIGAGLELGINLFHVRLYSDHVSESARNMLMMNAVYTAELREWLTLQIGGHGGFGRDEHLHKEVPVGFAYALLRSHPETIKLAGVVGGWVASASYVGPGWPAGPLLGLEYELVHEWLVLQADLLMGNNEAAVGVIGAVLLLPLGWQLAVGLQVPSPFSRNGLGAVVELTHVPPGSGEHVEPVRWQKTRMSPRWIREHKEKHGIDDDDDPADELPDAAPNDAVDHAP